jgi:hypothetical protein
MTKIDWKQLERNSESKEIGFERFCFQIAYRKFALLGHFDYYYDTPGSEFYLTLEKQDDDLKLNIGDIVGWQAKFWLNNKDDDNSPLDKKHRNELIEGFKKSLEYKPNLKKWIICTPGKFSNTKPAKAVDNLESELRKIEQNITIEYWHRDIFEAFAHEDTMFFTSLFNHYFSAKFIGFEFIKDYSEKRLNRLKEKFDIDLYVENKIDKNIALIIDPKKIHDELKNVLEKAIRMIDDYKYHLNIEGDEQLNYKYLDKDFFVEQKELAKARYDLIKKIHTLTIVSFNPKDIRKLIKEHREDFSSVVTGLNEKIENSIHFFVQEELNEDIHRERFLHDYYYKFITEISEYIFSRNDSNISIEYLIDLSLQQDIHIFGSAGYGKTNLACAICKKHLAEGMPALLILGSSINSGFSPQEQIIASLDLKTIYSFKDLLFALNSLGEHKCRKIPIIIDGLNESTPTAKIWREHLPDIIQDMRSFQNLLLITTLRDAYVNQVFEKKRLEDVENHYKIIGFDTNNIKYVIRKYFSKYNISAQNGFNENIFENPLLLKIFCEANRNISNAIITQFGLYKAIEDYINKLIDKVSDLDDLKIVKIKDGLEAFSKKLWDSNDRFISYPNEYGLLINGQDNTFENTIAHKMMDEGMFFQRNINEDNEVIQFTYDLIGGYCIAKYYLLKNKTEKEIVLFINSNEFKKLSQTDLLHPLAEDILKAIFYLVPTICKGRDLYKITGVEINPTLYIDNLDIMSQTVNNKKELIDFFLSLSLNELEINLLCERIYKEVIEQNTFNNVDVLFHCYFKWNNYQRDIYWNEKTRIEYWRILNKLEIISEEKYFNNLSKEEIYNHLLFCVLLFSSTYNEIRNLATKSAVLISQINQNLILKILKLSIGLSDLYVLERIVAVLCGVILRTKDKDFTLECCEYLQKEFLPNTLTNHVVILDYIETIFTLGKKYFNYQFNENVFYRNINEIWENNVEDNSHVSIFSYDFIKYQICDIARDNNIKLSDIDISTKLYHRCKLYGYSKELYLEFERNLFKEIQRYETGVDSKESYRFKYIWTSYYEFIGYLLINKAIKKENHSIFRINDIFIDPTFSQQPPKMQLINDCFLPSYGENVQDWVNNERDDYFNEIYSTKLPEEDNNDWILLKAYCNQINNEHKNKSEIYISIISIIFNSAEMLEFIKTTNWDMNGVYNIYSGELPHCIYNENFDDENDCAHGDICSVTTRDYSFKSWNNQRTNLCERFPFLSREIALWLELQFNPVDLSYYHKNEKVTKYIWCDNSKFYFIKKEFLKHYLNNYNFQILHRKFITKYNNLEVLEQEETEPSNPPYKDIVRNDVFELI